MLKKIIIASTCLMALAFSSCQEESGLAPAKATSVEINALEQSSASTQRIRRPRRVDNSRRNEERTRAQEFRLDDRFIGELESAKNQSQVVRAIAGDARRFGNVFTSQAQLRRFVNQTKDANGLFGLEARVNPCSAQNDFNTFPFIFNGTVSSSICSRNGKLVARSASNPRFTFFEAGSFFGFVLGAGIPF